MKRIIHLLSTDYYSGAENVACQIINMFKKNNSYELIYVSKISPALKKILDDKGIKYYELKDFQFKYIKQAIKDLSPSVIHAHDVKASIMASFFYKKIKIVSHIHSNHENMRIINIKTLLYNLFSNRFNKIIWVSKGALNSYIFNKNVQKKSIVLYNVIDKNEIYDKIKKDKFKYDSFDLVFLGRLVYAKNPERLIRIVNSIKKELPKVRVAIVGSGSDEAMVKKMIGDLNLQNNIKMFGFCSNPYKIVSLSKMMILTSRYEGLPMCVLEAISLGKPIISTPTDGLVEIIDSSIGYLTNDDSKMVNKIVFLLNNESELNRIGKNVLIKSSKLNNLKSYKNELIKIYK